MNAPLIPTLPKPLWQQDPAVPDEPVLPLTVEAYHALRQAGALADGDPIELLEGFLVRKMTKGPRHEWARRQLRRLLERLISAEYFVDEQGAFTTNDSEPEPDVFIIRGTLDDFVERHAAPNEVALVAEVAHSSMFRDRVRKKRVYARAAIPVYWIVNLADDCVEVHSLPTGPTSQPAYSQTTVYRSGEQIPVVIDDKQCGQIAVDSLLRGPQGQP
jgi:hypothetical protein